MTAWVAPTAYLLCPAPLTSGHSIVSSNCKRFFIDFRKKIELNRKVIPKTIDRSEFMGNIRERATVFITQNFVISILYL